MPRKPAFRLVLRPVEPGLHHVIVNRVLVGHVYDIYDERDPWHGAREARLYAVAGCSDVAADIVSGLRLRDVRHQLQDRLAEKGPWWT